MTTNWKFLEKIFYNRSEKHNISKYIVSKYIINNHNILLDSGSTIDLITLELIKSEKKDITITSNNIFAAMHLVGQKKIEFNLLEGMFSDLHAATYSKKANDIIADKDFNFIIIAATAISVEAGIMVGVDDDGNADFKKAALDNFQQSTNAKLIIAVDGTKFFKDTTMHRGVLNIEDWKIFINKYKDRICIITSPLRPSVENSNKNKYEKEISRFAAVNQGADFVCFMSRRLTPEQGTGPDNLPPYNQTAFACTALDASQHLDYIL